MARKIRAFVAMVVVIALCLQITPMAANVTQFSDVPSNHWAYEGINFVISRGYMGETQDGLFEPDSTANRGMIITVLYRLAGQPSVNATSKPFSDVELGVWYSNPIIWAKNIGIIDGHDDGTFRPTNTMPREQIALIMYRYAQTLNYDVNYAGSDYTKFSDFSNTPTGCQPAMKWAIKKDMLIGRADNNLHPNAAATRAELATCVYRFVTNNRKVTGISIVSTKSVEAGWVGKITPSLSPVSDSAHYANPKISWRSSDTSVATVSSSGQITTVNDGVVEITATTDDGGYTATCTLQVIDHHTVILNNLTHNELYYLYSPQTLLVSSGIPLETRLEFIELFKKYADGDDIEGLRDELNSKYNGNLTLNNVLYLWSEYKVGANGNFTPEMQLVATQQYLGTIKLFISLVTFDVAARLTPFDANGNIKYNPTKADLQADYAHAMTNNASSNKVMLGSGQGEGIRYHIAARAENMTYFHSRTYYQLEAQYGPEYMQEINRQFLQQQKAAGKEFWFSHDPRTAYPGSNFEMEVNWVKNNFGITEFTDQNLVHIGNYWKLMP